MCDQRHPKIDGLKFPDPADGPLNLLGQYVVFARADRECEHKASVCWSYFLGREDLGELGNHAAESDEAKGVQHGRERSWVEFALEARGNRFDDHLISYGVLE